MFKIFPDTKNISRLVYIILAVFFSLAAGFLGGWLSRFYLPDSFYFAAVGDSPAWEKGWFEWQKLIQQKGKSIVIEQDQQAAAVAAAGWIGLVGIFPKDSAEKLSLGATTLKAYRISSAVGQGAAVTSDGWILTSWRPVGLEKDTKPEKGLILWSGYEAMDAENNIYAINDYRFDPLTDFYFFHLAGAKNLTLKQFAARATVAPGQMVVAFDWQGRAEIAFASQPEAPVKKIMQSDEAAPVLLFRSAVGPLSPGAMIYNLAGEIAALLDRQQAAIPAYYFQSALGSLLKSGEIRRANFGVAYQDLSDFSSLDGAAAWPSRQGALVLEIMKPSAGNFNFGSALDLKTGDLITAINGQELNVRFRLSDAVLLLPPDRDVEIDFFRAGKKMTARAAAPAWTGKD